MQIYIFCWDIGSLMLLLRIAERKRRGSTKKKIDEERGRREGKRGAERRYMRPKWQGSRSGT
eukprot:9100984-Pyramimonas_sp.AAC.1